MIQVSGSNPAQLQLFFLKIYKDHSTSQVSANATLKISRKNVHHIKKETVFLKKIKK